MSPPPDLITVRHLHDMVKDVALVMFEPVIQAQLAARRLFRPVRFRSLLQRNEQSMCRLAKAADDLERFPCALMTIPERLCPACRIESQIEASAFSDIASAADIRAGLTIRKVQYSLVDT